MQTLGQIVGPLLSYNIFVYYMDKVEMIGFKFFSLYSIFIIVTTLLSFAFIKENYRKSEFKSALDIVKIFPSFYLNSNLRFFISFGFLTRIFMAYWSTIG